jgi:Flp pilus assembly pilin Flp
MLKSAEACSREIQRSILELFRPGSEQNQRGQDMLEFALLAGFIAVAIAAVVPYSITAPVSSVFSKIQFYMKAWGNA